MAHRRNNHAIKPTPNTKLASFSPVAPFMDPTVASSAHSLPLLRSQRSRSFSFATSSHRYERELKPIYTPAARKFKSSDGDTQNPNYIPPSAPSSLYETGSGSLYTEGLLTRMEKNEITSLERIRKRKGAPMKLKCMGMPERSSFEATSSQSMLPTALATTPVSANRRSLQIESSPWIPPHTPTGFYLKPQANATMSTVPSSGDRRRAILSRNLSSMSLRGRGTGDIWEQASQDKENFDKTQSLSGMKKKGIIAHGLRRGIDQIMGKRRGDNFTSSPIDYVVKASTRYGDLSSHPQSVYGASPILPPDTQSVHSSPPSPTLSQMHAEFPSSPNTISYQKIEYIHPKLQKDCAHHSSRSHCKFRPSPLFGHFLSRSLSSSSNEELDICSSPPTVSIVQPFKKSEISDSVKVTCEMSLMTPTDMYSQVPILAPMKPDRMFPKEVPSPELVAVSTYLTLMSPKSIFSQEPVLTSEKLTIMDPKTAYSQVHVSVDSPWFFFVLSIMLPLFLSTTQALNFALHHIGSEMSYNLVIEIVKGWLIGVVLDILVHAVPCEVTHVPRNWLYMVAWLMGLLVCGVGNFVGVGKVKTSE